MAWRDSVTVHRAILSFNFFFFNDTATTEIYPLSLHDALPISKTRAELIDESLAILEGLWSGEPFAFEGHYFQFGPMTFRPTPVQRPRIPIWVVGAWPSERSMRRVLRWDGIVTQTDAVDEVRAIVEYVERERPADLRDQPFEIVVQGSTAADDPARASETVRPYAD